ncbi:MAG TPA: HAMP domain-containing sensor histidine kinase [Candidatus Deferrimicrobium sp.]|nr:HAMP domain-containing sensor histidine kinase [Candidatus Deferrimicrobium sp.]
MALTVSPRTALILFVIMVVFLFAQGLWWVIFMAQLVDEKVDLAERLGGTSEFIERIHREEISRQVMLGMEGIVFLLVLLAGLWVIYRTLTQLQDLKFHQQNFLMAVTHELKTPLSSMLVYLETLQSPKISAEKKTPIIPRLKEDVVRLQKLVDNVLEAGRLERTRYRVDREPIDFSALVQDRIGALERIPLSRPLKIDRRLESGLTVSGDPGALTRAIDAILENALKYNVSSPIVITVSLHAIDEKAVLEISDNGIGLLKKDVKFIFERFARVGNEMTRQSEGTGLGLYLCREIVKAHGGTITASSDGLGTGTKFTITLRKSG